MNLWGAAPLLAAALLGGGAGAHTVTAHSTIQLAAAHAAARPAAAPTPSVAAASTPGPVLSQVGSSRQWKTTLVLNANTPACQHVASSYWLETTPPGPAISGTSTPAWQAGTARKKGSSCGVTVTFKGVSGVPKTATLILDEAGASSSIPLTVSRHVTVFDYLWIPVITGAVMALLALIGSLFAVSIYTSDGRRLSFRRRDFWAHPILASGAWTLNDSWATNITTVISVIATVLGTTTAVSAFFPGVAVDRFVIVNIIAGGIIAASPLVFAICYALWVGRSPGVTADATLRLPMTATLIATLDPAAALMLPKGTTVLPASGKTARLPADTRADLASATPALLAAGRSIRLAATVKATLPPFAEVTLPAGTAVRFGGRRSARHAPPVRLADPADVLLPSGGRAALPASTMVRLAGGPPAMLAAGPAAASLRARALVLLPDGRVGVLARATAIELPDAAAVTLPAQARVTASAGWPATLTDGASVILPPDAGGRIGVPAGTPVTVLPGALAQLAAGATARAASVGEGPSVTIGVVSGAKITVPGGAAVSALGGDGPPPRQVKAGHAILVPPASYIGVAAGASMSLPGDTNITVPGDSTLTIGGSARSLTIAGDDLMPVTPPAAHGAAAPPAAADGHPGGAEDACFPYPVRVAAAGGAEISVTGLADFSLPRDTVITAPLRAVSVLPRDRQLQVPQGSNMIAANLVLILLGVAVTMFGIGAELGIIGVLALGLSEASTTGLVLMGIAMLVVALGAIVYAVTATRTLADPQPGSSMSATSGTSFTL
jgi:hypothetical protein